MRVVIYTASGPCHEFHSVNSIQVEYGTEPTIRFTHREEGVPATVTFQLNHIAGWEIEGEDGTTDPS